MSYPQPWFRLDVVPKVWLDELTPANRKCRMEARRVDRDTAESVAGIGLLLRRAAALVWVRADQEGQRLPDAVLIIFASFWRVTRLYLSMQGERGY